MSVTRFDPFGDSFRYGARTECPLDVWKAADGYHIEMDVPGIDPRSVEISIDRDILTIGVEREPDYRAGESVVVAERPEGSFTRQLRLSGNLDVDHIQETRTCSDGVLHVTIPMADG